MEFIVERGRRLGRRPPKHAPAIAVEDVLTSLIPVHPAVADHLTEVQRWMLGANDTWGTCGPTGVSNSAVIVWKYALGEDITVTDDAVFDLYRRSGNPGFDPNLSEDDPRQEDNGVDLQTMLEALLKGGIEITHADGRKETVRPVGFAKVKLHDLDAIRAATSIFGCVLFGLLLQTAQRSQTDALLWDYVSSPTWGGHATVGGRYHTPVSPHADDIDNVTWEEVVGTTDAFMSRQMEEGWVILWPPLLDHPAFQAGVDMVAFAAAYTALTGRPFPVPVIPPAPPAPPPPAPPADDVVTQFAALWRKFVSEVEQLLQRFGH